VVAWPCEASWELDVPSGECVAPLRLGGIRGKQSTPSDWLGGTGEVSTVGEREWHRARDVIRGRALRQRYTFRLIDRIL
jgi:hypothetical protein